MRGKERVPCILARVVAVNMQTGTKVDLYTVPASKKAIILAVNVHRPTASLAGGTDYDFGDGASCNTWKQATSLADLTSTSHYRHITSNDTTYAVLDAGDVFGMIANTGSTLAATATIDVIGYEEAA